MLGHWLASRRSSSSLGVESSSFLISRSPPWVTRNSATVLKRFARRTVQRGVASTAGLVDGRSGASFNGRLDGVQHPAFIRPLGGDELGGDQPAAAIRAAVSTPVPTAAMSAVVPSSMGRSGSAPAAARSRMISGSRYFAASINGVAPFSLAVKMKLIRPTGNGRAFGESSVRVRPLGQKRLHQRGIGSRDTGMQGGVAGARRIGIGAFLEQELTEPSVATHRSHDQCAVAVRCRGVHVGTGIQQEPSRADIAVARGKQQGREASGAEVRGARGARCASLPGTAQLTDGCRSRGDRCAHARAARA